MGWYEKWRPGPTAAQTSQRQSRRRGDHRWSFHASRNLACQRLNSMLSKDLTIMLYLLRDGIRLLLRGGDLSKRALIRNDGGSKKKRRQRLTQFKSSLWQPLLPSTRSRIVTIFLSVASEKSDNAISRTSAMNGSQNSIRRALTFNFRPLKKPLEAHLLNFREKPFLQSPSEAPSTSRSGSYCLSLAAGIKGDAH